MMKLNICELIVVIISMFIIMGIFLKFTSIADKYGDDWNYKINARKEKISNASKSDSANYR